MKHTIKGFITYEKSKYTKNPCIEFSSYKPSAEYSPDKVLICEYSFEFDMPENFDPRPQLIGALKAKEQKARADFEALITDIQRQISQYEAITNEVGA